MVFIDSKFSKTQRTKLWSCCDIIIIFTTTVNGIDKDKRREQKNERKTDSKEKEKENQKIKKYKQTQKKTIR